MKGKALRRALAVDSQRVGSDVPLIVDTTELISPLMAQEMLQHNKRNRPINWRKVEEYADLMAQGKWQLHAQGIVLDTDGNVLTGQKRLWAVVYSGVNVYFRISRGNPADSAKLLDRGTPQTARDLAARGTGHRHSPVEASIARGYCALMGNLKPSTDVMAEVIETNSDIAAAVLAEVIGTKKTRAVVMVLAAICVAATSPEHARCIAAHVEFMSAQLVAQLVPATPQACWGRGAAFSLAMETAKRIVEGAERRTA